MNTATETDTRNAWQIEFYELAGWTLSRLAIKTDRFGLYSPRGGASWATTPVTGTILRRHFHGRHTIGLGSTSPDDQCLWVAWDFDNHVTDVATNVNLNFAIVLRDNLRALGFNNVVIEDSDGKGGIHVWLFFASPIPAKLAYQFSKWIAQDYKKHGLEKIECFPKNSTVQHTPAKCGHYLRIPGKHHKRAHWSRFYGADDWLSQADSVQLLLSQTGDDPALIPTLPEEPQRPPSAPRFMSAGSSSDRDEALARDALGSLDPDCGYSDWLKIGQALHSAGDTMLPLWIEWSAGSKDFDADECRDKWKTFHRGNGGVGLGTLFSMAKENGWVRPPRKYVRAGETTGAIDTNDDGKPAVIAEELPANAVELVLDEMAVNDAVIEILAKGDGLYDHNGQLAIVLDREDEEGFTQAFIHVLCLAGIRELISERCRFFVWVADKEAGEDVPDWKRIPKWCYEGVLVRGLWGGIKLLRAVVNCPVLRPDGTVVQAAGYDSASALFVDLQEEFPPIPEDPTADQLESAANLLRDVVCDFPFKTEAHLAAWVAAVLTPIAREGYRGPTSPFFLIDANVRGSGKTLLGDLISLIDEGREATRFTAPQNDEESRKRITALVENNDRVILIDNIVGAFGCASLDAALTGTVWKDRRLGHSTMVEAPLKMTWLGSGNNVVLAADTARRVCHIRLESRLENPEDRAGFKYADIRKYVRQHRPALLTAALTILRGFIAAGRPDMNLKPWGSFEGWSDLVRQSVVFAGFDDPGKTREELRETSDSEAGALHQMLQVVKYIDRDKKGFLAGQLLRIADGFSGPDGQIHSHEDSKSLREAIEQFCDGTFERINSRRLGNRLKHFRNRVCDGLLFDFSMKDGNRRWFVKSVSGSSGSSDSQQPEPYARKKTDVQHSTSVLPRSEYVEPEPLKPLEPLVNDFDFDFKFGK